MPVLRRGPERGCLVNRCQRETVGRAQISRKADGQFRRRIEDAVVDEEGVTLRHFDCELHETE